MEFANEIKKQMINPDINYYPEEHREYISVSEFINNHLELNHLSKKEVFIALDISESIGYKYLAGRRAIPRDIFLKFNILFSFSLEQVQFYLLNFGYANLYIKNRRDSALIYCLLSRYSYLQTKHYLCKHNITAL